MIGESEKTWKLIIVGPTLTVLELAMNVYEMCHWIVLGIECVDAKENSHE